MKSLFYGNFRVRFSGLEVWNKIFSITDENMGIDEHLKIKTEQ